MDKVFEELGRYRIVPVIKLTDAARARPLGEALIKGGLPVAEVTFRTDAAEESIRIMTTELPEMIVGAGTVLTADQVRRAASAGARFIVSPGWSDEVFEACGESEVPYVPGTATPTEVQAARDKGLKVLKLFPATVVGGKGLLKALYAVYPDLMFMPTGGISLKNLEGFLDLPNVQHLWSPIRARVHKDVTLFDLAQRLHPTPAGSGSPRSIVSPGSSQRPIRSGPPG